MNNQMPGYGYVFRIFFRSLHLNWLVSDMPSIYIHYFFLFSFDIAKQCHRATCVYMCACVCVSVYVRRLLMIIIITIMRHVHKRIEKEIASISMCWPLKWQNAKWINWTPAHHHWSALLTQHTGGKFYFTKISSRNVKQHWTHKNRHPKNAIAPCEMRPRRNCKTKAKQNKCTAYKCRQRYSFTFLSRAFSIRINAVFILWYAQIHFCANIIVIVTIWSMRTHI